MGMIFVNRDRRSLGQFTEQEISNGLNSGQLLPDDLAWQEGMETWQPLSSFTNIPPPGVITVNLGGPVPAKDVIDRRQKPGKIRFDECFGKAWECFAANWGVCVIATLIFFGISIIAQMPMQFAQAMFGHFTKESAGTQVGMMIAAGVVFFFFWALASGISSILSAGFMYFFVGTLRTGKANLDNLFSGFKGTVWVQILLAMATWCVAVIVIAVVFVIPGVFLTATTKSEMPAILSAALVIIPVIYLSVSLGFVFPLIVDRKIGFWDAIVTCLKTVHRQWFPAFGLLILVALLTLVGMLFCCVGALATMPFAYLIWCQGYRQLFGDPSPN